MCCSQQSVIIIFILILIVNGQSNFDKNTFSQKHQHHQKFEQFKKSFSKAYESEEVQQFRFATFVENLNEIDRLNAEVTTAQFDISFFSDYTKEEFLNLFTGAHKLAISDQDQSQNNDNQNNQNTQSNNQTSQDNQNVNQQKQTKASNPTTWDIRVNGPGKLQEIKNQGGCGSCWAFSTSVAVESYYSAKKNITVSLSEQQQVDCVYDRDGCQGGWFTDSFDYAKLTGLMTESAYPYQGAYGSSCQFSNKTSIYKIKSYQNLQKNNSVIQKAVMQNGAVSVAVDGTYWAHYKSGIFTQKQKPQLNHAVAIVGWGSGYWLLRNSWGTSWGDQGYIKVSSTGNGGIFTQYAYQPN
ncbi:papain family cysteine protease (macronuclear) [Tetrahymena thermophila SB210]|uniref:Papain family cysteine protease n=1 Tax=Tetrahymena thermophila (strain SB210) TaxID=312017 RepID=Q22DX4_TETTS|nr:papain family cysteine protease [Tetrahymena thermophila SB210]EAR83538.1 papain family cysteine protease [Tetrahymena thermophila SB210]|eukprot:XP_001031201.1 papain family cysteine protease [Tetrahymena thermophila SB210]